MLSSIHDSGFTRSVTHAAWSRIFRSIELVPSETHMFQVWTRTPWRPFGARPSSWQSVTNLFYYFSHSFTQIFGPSRHTAAAWIHRCSIDPHRHVIYVGKVCMFFFHSGNNTKIMFSLCSVLQCNVPKIKWSVKHSASEFLYLWQTIGRTRLSEEVTLCLKSLFLRKQNKFNN